MKKVIIVSQKEWDAIQKNLDKLAKLEHDQCFSLEQIIEQTIKAEKLIKYLEEKSEQHIQDLMDFSYREDRLAEEVAALAMHKNYVEDEKAKLSNLKLNFGIYQDNYERRINNLPKWFRWLFKIKKYEKF